MKRILAGIILIVPACVAFGQTAARSSFEVASIKPTDPAATGMRSGVLPACVFSAKGATVKALIQQCYDVRDFQVSGGPGWLDTQRYDIVAKGDAGGPSEDDLRQMTDAQRKLFQQQLLDKLRALLADRFQLKVHRETREMPVYALTIARNGPKIQVATDSDVTHTGLTVRRGSTGKPEITGTRIPLSYLVKTLSDQVGRTVTDETGLTGNYDFKLSFTPDQGAAASSPDTDGPSIFTALEEQLGLRLEAKKGPVPVVVIDSVQKASEN